MRRRFTGNHDYVVITSSSNAEVMSIMYANGLCANSGYMLKSECEKVTDEQLYRSSDTSSSDYYTSIFSGNTVKHFDEFKYFTGITILGAHHTTLAGGVFKNCTLLTSILLPNKVTALTQQAFYGCTGLTSITLPSSFKTFYGAYNSDVPFYGCTNLKEIKFDDISNVTVSTSQSKYSIAGNCTLTHDIYYTSIHRLDYVQKTTESYTVPSDCTMITGYVFADSSLSSVTISDSVTNIQEANFANTKLTTLTIPDSVTGSINGSIKGNNYLKTVKVGAGVTSIDNHSLFNNALLESLTLSEGLIRIMSYSIFYNPKLSTITLPSSITRVGYYCCQNDSGNLIISPATSIATEIPSTIYAEAASFMGPYELEIIQRGIYIKCKHSATTLNISDASITKIGEYAFSGSNVTSIVITSPIARIGDGALSGNTTLCDIDIPSTVTSFGYFWAAAKIKNLICRVVTPIPMRTDTIPKEIHNIYVPSASVDAYKTTQGWSLYADKIQAISE